MADENVPAPAPTRSDDQILPFAAWVPIEKSNHVLDLQKRKKNLIFQIAVDILQNINFFRAFTASASVPTIYIQQFWNTLTYPWRAILSMINQCLTGKTSGHDRMSTPVFVDPESSTQADGAQSSRVPVPLPEDPYEAIRQAYLESEGSGTSSAGSTSSDSTTPLSPDHPLTRDTPVLVPSLRRTAPSSLDVAFHKRFRSSYEGSPSPLPTLLVRKRYESCAGDEDPNLDDEGYGLDDESRGIDDDGHSVERDGLGLEEGDEVVPEGQQQAAPVIDTIMGEWYGYQEKNKNKDKTGQNRARDQKEREKTSPTLPSNLIGPARNPFYGMSTPVFVNSESSTQADDAQSTRVPVPLPKDPYDAIRQANLVGTDTESEPFEDLRSESPESPHIVASPISFPDSTPPIGHVEGFEGSGTSSAGSTSSDSTTPLSPDYPLTCDTPVLVPSLRRNARMAMRIQPALSPGYSARLAEVTSMSDIAFHKRFRSFYESSPSPSPTLLVRKRYKGTSELILGTNSEGDELGDEEVSLDSDSRSEDAKDEGPAAGDEDPGLDDKGYGLDDESCGIDDEGHSVESDGLGLEEEDEAGSGSAPELERSERVSAFRQPAFTTWTDPEDGTVYIDVLTYPPSAPPIQTPPSPDWTPGSLPISPSHSDVPSPVSSPLISLTVPSPVATLTATIPVDEDQFIVVGAQLELYRSILQDYTQRLDAMPHTLFAKIDRDVRELYTRSGAVRDEIFSQSFVETRAGIGDMGKTCRHLDGDKGTCYCLRVGEGSWRAVDGISVVLRFSVLSGKFSCDLRKLVTHSLSNTSYSSQQINMAYPLPLDMAYRSFRTETEIIDFRAKNFLPSFGTNPTDCLSLVSVARPKIEEKDSFELKGQFLKELQENTFSCSDNEDTNEHIEKVLKIVNLFYVPNITVDQLMLRVFPISLSGAASHWLRNKPINSIKTWEDLKTKFLNKYCPPGRTAKKMEEINNFQQEQDETLLSSMGAL
ncbi:reverse transcriptase domain-containing protein [Tanacetum coccineum]|uniref:Reverse transcriptase domain-containing protein n=1 Tax=Tanacetum coccineum TaxID=301880 RepID=A0ABQ5BUD0_9ASTR